MASTLDTNSSTHARVRDDDELAVVIDADAYDEAIDDPRVKDLHDRADALLRSYESDGRSL